LIRRHDKNDDCFDCRAGGAGPRRGSALSVGVACGAPAAILTGAGANMSGSASSAGAPRSLGSYIVFDHINAMAAKLLLSSLNRIK